MRIIFMAVLGFLMAAGPSARAAETSLCPTQEKVIFSCPAGRDTISVCATPDFGAAQGLLTYRFGRDGKEFSLPATPAVKDKPADDKAAGPKVYSRALMFSGGGGAYLRFTNEGYSYIVFTAVGKGWGEKQGVAVEKDGKTLSYHRCTAEPVSELGPEFFDHAGIPEDAEEFLLPD
jgi:hypothetical protein